MKRRFSFFLIALIILSRANAQEQAPLEQEPPAAEEQLESGLQESGEFIQVLKWKSQGIVSKYTVTVEQNINGTFTEVKKEDTQQEELVVSLEPGLYRFKVDFYNALRRLAFSTDWEDFEILVAYEPTVRSASPRMIYLEEENDGVFTVEGRNLMPNAEFLLKNANTGNIVQEPLNINTNDRGTRSVLTFNIDKIDVGTYEVKVTNPGGLSAQSEQIKVQFKKPMDLDISAGIAVPYILFDDTFEHYMGSNIYPFGIGAKVCFIPFKHRWGYLGAEIIGSATKMDADFGAYSIDGYMFSSHLNFVYQQIFAKRRLIFEAFAGAGVLTFNHFYFHFPHNIESQELNSINPSVDAGVALDIYITKRIFIDITAQFVYGFTKDMQIGMILPRASLGYQF